MIKPNDRQRILTQTRNLKMARFAHSYVRGSTIQFYEWLGSNRRCKLPEGPQVWICGDCHVGNLGPLADAKGRVLVQIRDLDQTVIGNPVHDLVRLGLSLASAARGSDLPGVTTAKILEELNAGYRAALLADFGRQGHLVPAQVYSDAACTVHKASMATFGVGSARHDQTYYPAGKAILGSDTGRAQGLEPYVRKRLRCVDAHFTPRSGEGRAR